MSALKLWVKRRESPLARLAYALAARARTARLPVIRPLHRVLYAAHLALRRALAEALRVLWWTPLFVSRLETDAPGLVLYSGMPQGLGPLRIRVGSGVRISGVSTLIGRSATVPLPLLEIGDNADIGWRCALSVGRRIVIGDNVRLAGRCLLACWPASRAIRWTPPTAPPACPTPRTRSATSCWSAMSGWPPG